MVAPGCTKRLPLVDYTSPAAIFKGVDLPEPLRPIKQTRSADDADNSTPDNSGVPPKVSAMSFNWISGGAMDFQFNSVFVPAARRAGCGGWSDRAPTETRGGRAARGVWDRRSLRPMSASPSHSSDPPSHPPTIFSHTTYHSA